VAKVIYEVVATPLTYLVVNKLKSAEGIDVYDTDTNFSPFGREKAPVPAIEAGDLITGPVSEVEMQSKD
jgi:hypothetical protein